MSNILRANFQAVTGGLGSLKNYPENYEYRGRAGKVTFKLEAEEPLRRGSGCVMKGVARKARPISVRVFNDLLAS